MKKALIVLILALVFVLSFTLCISAADGNSEVDPQTKSPCEMILGDVDGDGEVTNADVLMIYRYIYNPELFPLPTICVHEFGDDSYYETTVVSATCSSEGYTLYTCKYCGFSYCDDFTEKTAHTFGDWEEMLSFCTARIMMRSCTECDYSMFNIENGDWHKYTSTVVEPTCTNEGYTLHKCETCNLEYRDTFTEKTPHTFGDWEEMTSSCTTKFLMCSCTECGYSMFNIKNGDWHKYTPTVVEPTCTNEGYTLHKCETCNLECRNTFTEKTPHTFGDWEEMTSSCTTKISMCSCTECGYSTFRTENGDWHKYTSTVVKPTCSARGYTLYSCQNCNSSYTENYVDATGEHTWKELYVITSTCAEKKIVAICTYCNTTQILEGTPTEEHDYVVTVVPPTIEEQGYTEHTCKICGDSFKDSFVPVIGSVGLKFTSNGDGTCYVSGIGTCTDTDLVIPSMSPKGDRVTSIGNWAFDECTSLTSVTIPDSVTSIGRNAFYSCTSLTSVTFGENSELTSIDTWAFGYCTSLASIDIPDSVTSIGNYAFYNCTSLTSVTFGENSELTSIGSSAFEGCTSLESIEIPDSVMSIGSSAFQGCTSLKDVYITDIEAWLNISFGNYSSSHPNYYGNIHILDKEGNEITEVIIPDSVSKIGDYAFYNCTSLTSVTILDSVTSIGGSAFYNCTSLTSVTIGNSVTSIGNYAFRYCTSLTSVTFGENSELTSIGEYAFRGCTSLTSVTIPDSVTSIGRGTFYSCTSLTSVTIGNSVTSIGSGAFEDCASLTSVTIPDSVTSIDEWAFEDCTSLKDVYYTGTQEQWKKISIRSSGNSYLTSATIHYNCVAS